MNDHQVSQTERLLKLKSKVDEAKAAFNRLEGQLDRLFEELGSEFNCKTAAAANKKLKTIGKQIDEKEQHLGEQMEEIESAMKENSD